MNEDYKRGLLSKKLDNFATDRKQKELISKGTVTLSDSEIDSTLKKFSEIEEILRSGNDAAERILRSNENKGRLLEEELVSGLNADMGAIYTYLKKSVDELSSVVYVDADRRKVRRSWGRVLNNYKSDLDYLLRDSSKQSNELVDTLKNNFIMLTVLNQVEPIKIYDLSQAIFQRLDDFHQDRYAEINKVVDIEPERLRSKKISDSVRIFSSNFKHSCADDQSEGITYRALYSKRHPHEKRKILGKIYRVRGKVLKAHTDDMIHQLKPNKSELSKYCIKIDDTTAVEISGNIDRATKVMHSRSK